MGTCTIHDDMHACSCTIPVVLALGKGCHYVIVVLNSMLNITIYRMTSMNSTQLSSFAILVFLVSEGME